MCGADVTNNFVTDFWGGAWDQYSNMWGSIKDEFKPGYPDPPKPPPDPPPMPEEGARRIWEPLPLEEEEASQPIGLAQLRIPTPPTVNT